MGPRELPRGDASQRLTQAVQSALQWGRGNYPAETREEVDGRADAIALQWGRGNYPAENGGNGADREPISGLQWGRGNYPAEIRISDRLG